MNKFLKEFSTFIFSLIEIMLVFRFIFKLFGVSDNSDFVNFIYQNTSSLIAPFLLAFPSSNVSGKFVLEFTTLFAIFIYAFASYISQEFLDFIKKK